MLILSTNSAASNCQIPARWIDRRTRKLRGRKAEVDAWKNYQMLLLVLLLLQQTKKILHWVSRALVSTGATSAYTRLFSGLILQSDFFVCFFLLMAKSCTRQWKYLTLILLFCKIFPPIAKSCTRQLKSLTRALLNRYPLWVKFEDF